ncbi:hypothetical protein AYO45_06155 [Gammaproteobacteria bacterium SCGC AG-212-F23]|nr:hypothetical protein AYO45_06155 [Gammaproteobacteria bacterium SCGC AG-212-F23]
MELLQAMQTVFGADRVVVIARELTKLFETIHSGVLSDVISWMEQDANQQRGEIVVLVSGAKESLTENKEGEKILKILLAELPLKQAVDLAAKITGARKNELYELALSLR